jgi:hypothetical protein
VSHYDHFCIWVGVPIGRDNRKWFLLFCLGMCTCGGLFWHWADSPRTEQHDDIYLAVVSTRALMGSVATLCLLLRQTWLVTVGLTTYESLYKKDLESAGWIRRGEGGGCSGCWTRWREVLMPIRSKMIAR